MVVFLFNTNSSEPVSDRDQMLHKVFIAKKPLPLVDLKL